MSELPREIKLEMSIGQSESKLVQDVNLVSDIPTPFHAEDEIRDAHRTKFSARCKFG